MAHVHMQHQIRKAAKEAEAYGIMTYKDLTPAQKKHINDRVS